MLLNRTITLDNDGDLVEVDPVDVFDALLDEPKGLVWICSDPNYPVECAYVSVAPITCAICNAPVERFSERVELRESASSPLIAFYNNDWYWNGLHYERHYVNYDSDSGGAFGRFISIQPSCSKCKKKGLEQFHDFVGPYLYVLDPKEDPNCPVHDIQGDAVVLVENIRAWQGRLEGDRVVLRDHGARYSRNPAALGFEQRIPTRKYAKNDRRVPKNVFESLQWDSNDLRDFR